MSRVDFFDGITIQVRGREHLPPHFHCYYAEYEISIEIKTLKVIAGIMPNRQLRKIKNWAKGKENDLLEIFKLNNSNLKF